MKTFIFLQRKYRLVFMIYGFMYYVWQYIMKNTFVFFFSGILKYLTILLSTNFVCADETN